MKFAGLMLLMLGNGAILFFLSFFAVGGNGNADTVYLIWSTGSVWIFSVAIAAFVLQSKGKTETAFTLAFVTVPGYLAVFFAVHALISGYEKVKPNTAEFAAACVQAGAKYIQPPTKAVTSIAFDWDPKTYPPQTNFFRVDAKGNIQQERGGLIRLSSDIVFTENRCCQYEGRPLNGIGPYIRRSNPHSEYQGVTELTADALVKYSVSTNSTKDSKVWLKTVDVTFTDRRDNKLLASWRYIVDAPARRACGVTSELTIDEREFLLRAIAQK